MKGYISRHNQGFVGFSEGMNYNLQSQLRWLVKRKQTEITVISNVIINGQHWQIFKNIFVQDL